jgi:hypothetical protein
LRAGDRRGEVGAQKQHRVGNLVGCHVAAERDCRLVAPSGYFALIRLRSPNAPGSGGAAEPAPEPT